MADWISLDGLLLYRETGGRLKSLASAILFALFFDNIRVYYVLSVIEQLRRNGTPGAARFRLIFDAWETIRSVVAQKKGVLNAPT